MIPIETKLTTSKSFVVVPMQTETGVAPEAVTICVNETRVNIPSTFYNQKDKEDYFIVPLENETFLYLSMDSEGRVNIQTNSDFDIKSHIDVKINSD